MLYIQVQPLLAQPNFSLDFFERFNHIFCNNKGLTYVVASITAVVIFLEDHRWNACGMKMGNVITETADLKERERAFELIK